MLPQANKPSIAQPETPLSRTRRFWKRSGQTASTVLALLVFLASPWLIRLVIDQYSGAFDAGTLNAIALATLVAFADVFTATRLFKWNWPRLFADSRECIEQALLGHRYSDPLTVASNYSSSSYLDRNSLKAAALVLKYEKAQFRSICVRLAASFFLYFAYLLVLAWLSLAVLNLVPRGVQPPPSEASSSDFIAETLASENPEPATTAPALKSTSTPSASPKDTLGAPPSSSTSSAKPASQYPDSVAPAVGSTSATPSGTAPKWPAAPHPKPATSWDFGGALPPLATSSSSTSGAKHPPARRSVAIPAVKAKAATATASTPTGASNPK